VQQELLLRNINYQIKEGYTIPLVDDLKIEKIFKDKDKEKGDSVIDLVINIY
jgi:hypothetical protein